MATIEQLRGAEAAEPSAVPADLASLNMVVLTVAQLAAAQQILNELAEALRWDPAAWRDALRAGLDANDTTLNAIDARLVAMQKWEDLHDPDRVLSQQHLMEAATLASLVEADHGIGFSDSLFRELVDFIAELPW